MFSHAFAGARAAGLAMFAAALLAACGGDDAPQSQSTTPTSTTSRLVVDTGSATPVAGGTLTLKATLLAADGSELKGASFVWTSSDEAVATVVSASDKAPSASVIAPVGIYATIRTLAAGQADITATATLADGSRMTSITHLVVQAAPAKTYTLTLSPALLNVTAGAAAQTVAIAVRRSDGVDGAADLSNWSWTSDDASFVVTPDADGDSAQVVSPSSATAAATGTLTACADAPAGRLCANAALVRAFTPPPTYTVGGTVTGLRAYKSLELFDSYGDTRVINTDGTFSMPTPRLASTAYDVTVSGQPAGQTCMVSNGSGTLAAANVTNVAITCVQAQFVVVNSSASATLSIFRVNPDTGALSAVPGSPVATPGPLMDVAVSAMGMDAFGLANGGTKLVSYFVSPTTGEWIRLVVNDLTLEVPATALAFVDDRLITGNTLGEVHIYSLAGGAPGLRSGTMVPSAMAIRGITVSDQDVAYVADATGAVSALKIFYAGTPMLLGALPVNAMYKPVMLPTARSLYTLGNSSMVSAMTLDPATGAPLAATAFPVTGTPLDMALTPDGAFAYMIDMGGVIQGYRISSMPAVSLGAALAVIGGRTLRVDASGKFLYAPSYDGNLYGFAIDGTTGALTPVPGSPFPTGNGNVTMTIVAPKV